MVIISSTNNSFSVNANESEMVFPFQKGETNLPKNSVYYIIDDSEYITFHSVADGSVLFTSTLGNVKIGNTLATKDNIAQLFNNVAFAPTGGGGGGTTYTAGDYIDITNNVISVTGITGGSGLNVVNLTQEEYDNLPEKAENTIYNITDASPITSVKQLSDGDNYYTKEEIDRMLGNIETLLANI